MKLFFHLIIPIFLVFIFSNSSKAMPIIRDAELEIAIRLVTDPIIEAANLNPKDVNIYIVNNKDINAFVSGGKNIFIHTGLLSLSKDPNMLIGVMAHEIGHITGGHLLKGQEAARNSILKSTFGYMLGLAAAAAGSPQAGAAIASGTQHVVGRQYLKHTRTNEEAADQSALTFLDRAGISSRGLLQLLEVLYGKEVALYNELNPYTLTHPLSRQRVDHVRNHLKNSKFANNLVKGEIATIFARAITKLDAFLDTTEKTLKQYPKGNQSINARYARAIAYYKIPDLPKSLAQINSLIRQFPKDPFFVELKGQILFENGKIKEAIQYYQDSIKLLNNSALFKIQLATAQISSEDKIYLNSAIDNLKQALQSEKRNIFVWHQLAIAYGRQGKLDMSNLALAEKSLLLGDKKNAKRFLALAKKHIKPGSPAALRLKDIERTEKKGK